MLLAAGALLIGCRPEFDTLEEACQDSVPGSSKAPEAAMEAVGRGNCYRRLAGLAPARVDDQYSAAERAHARYAENNGLSGGVEDSTRPGFTGELAWNRLEAQGYDLPEDFESGYHFWTLEVPSVGQPSTEIDAWMGHWLTRQVLLQPGVVDSGYGRSGGITAYGNLSEFPSNDRVDQPVVYPKDGQVDVPYSVVNGFASEIIDENAVVGYPITITVSSAELGSDPQDSNPYSLVLLDQQILDEQDRLVPVYEIQPETTPQPFPYTVALVPEEPLEPNTTYRVFARVSWVDGIKNVEATFTTGSEGAVETPEGLDAESARRAAFQRGLVIQRHWVNGPQQAR